MFKKIILISMIILASSSYLFFSVRKENEAIDNDFKSVEEQVVDKQIANTKTNEKIEDEIIKEEKEEQDKSSSNNSSVVKNQEIKQETKNNSEFNDKTETKKEVNTNTIKETKPEVKEPVKENTQHETNKSSQPTMWEELGISEYDYYNSPMLKWQKVTHSSFESCQQEGNEKTEVKFNPETGESYQEYTDYWCYQVNSYSGEFLGVMLKLS